MTFSISKYKCYALYAQMNDKWKKKRTIQSAVIWCFPITSDISDLCSCTLWMRAWSSWKTASITIRIKRVPHRLILHVDGQYPQTTSDHTPARQEQESKGTVSTVTPKLDTWRLEKHHLVFFQSLITKFGWFCTHCSWLRLGKPKAIFCCFRPSVSRFGVLCCSDMLFCSMWLYRVVTKPI